MIGYPGCLHRDKNGNERMIDLPTRLLCDRIVMVTGEVTDELAESVVAQLLYLESIDKDKPINMFVMGPGGSVTAGFAIISTMNTINCPVSTTIVGQVASMSSVIAASGEKGHRKIYPNSRVMLHTVAAGTQGKIQDMTITLKEVERLNDLIFEHLSKCCDKSVEQLKLDCDRDFWMSEVEAVKYGCCDEITKPR